MLSRREFLHTASAAAVAAAALGRDLEPTRPLEEFTYRDVELRNGLAADQFQQTQSVLLSMNEDSLLKPFRLRAGLPAPGPEMGGWYDEVPLEKTESGGHGFAPAHSFGQWVSALARGYNANGNAAVKAKLDRILALYEPAISGKFYKNFRFPAYVYDKVVCGLIDAHQFAGMPQAWRLLQLTTNAAEPHLPPRALDRDEPQRAWRASVGDNTSNDYCWDESYTMPENLYLAWRRGAGERYRTMARRYLLDKTYFDPLSEGKNVLPNHHAYSFCNALSSAMQAWLSDGSEKHLRAGTNAFDMIDKTQSFATGGWGPNESFVTPNAGKLYASLNDTHRGFETPCGSYAHFKLTRYLLRVYRDGRYGDSMERVMYNTVLGAKQLQKDGRAFYYSDYHLPARKTYFPDKWPCCSGTLPQIAADYRIASYLRDGDDIFVNLYLPSTLRWVHSNGAQLSFEQSHAYPLQPNIKATIRASREADFALRLRVPAWSSSYSVRVNNQPVVSVVHKGFATVRREWKDGDRVELQLEMKPRLEAIDLSEPDVVALVQGPLVLFAITDHDPKLSRAKMLAAAKGQGPVRFQPFWTIKDETYMTYLCVA